MKASETREVVIGGVAMIVLAGIVAVSYGGGAAVGGPGDLSGYRLQALFNQVDGLGVGSPVYLSGVQIGSVDAMALDANYRVRVDLHIDPDVDLPKDTAAAIHTHGLFGSKFVTLDPGGSQTSLADGDTITYTQDALIVSQLLDLIISQGKAARGMGGEGAGDGRTEGTGPAPAPVGAESGENDKGR